MNPLANSLLALGSYKPVLTALLLPPTSLLLCLPLGWWLMRFSRPLGRGIMLLAGLMLWVLSTQSAAVWMSRNLLPQYPALSPEQVQQQNVQAIVVLGGGIKGFSPEFGRTQLNADSMQRLRYGVFLSKQLGLPLAYSGGVGWAQTPDLPSEASIAKETTPLEWNTTIAIVEGDSRDTYENGLLMHQKLQERGITRVALVTSAWHMPRALKNFTFDDLTVVPAPTGFISPYESPLLDLLPTGHGLMNSRTVLREWLGLLLTNLQK